MCKNNGNPFFPSAYNKGGGETREQNEKKLSFFLIFTNFESTSEFELT